MAPADTTHAVQAIAILCVAASILMGALGGHWMMQLAGRRHAPSPTGTEPRQHEAASQSSRRPLRVQDLLPVVCSLIILSWLLPMSALADADQLLPAGSWSWLLIISAPLGWSRWAHRRAPSSLTHQGSLGQTLIMVFGVALMLQGFGDSWLTTVAALGIGSLAIVLAPRAA